jgi:hypothetical protein
MPARQDQTLQIFLIICIFAFLVTAVVAYLGWKGYGEEYQRATGLDTQRSQLQSQVQTQQTEIEEQRQKMGFAPNDSAQAVKDAFDADMKKFAPGVAENASYRKVLETLHAALQTSAQRVASLEDERKKLTIRAEAVEAAANQQIEEYNNQRKQAEEKLAAEQNKFAQDRANLESTKEELMKTVADQKAAFDAELAKFTAERQQLQAQIDKLTRANDILKDQRKDEPSSFEVADGRISWVDQNGTVWINLGSADSLRPQVTFSVYESGQQDADKAAKKGSIEVTRVMREHMSEARITEDDPTNPILVGDHIYSQVWHRGKRIHFALTGLIDIDGDGRSDTELARNLIQMNDGVVDAYLKDDGTVEGEITANTRYLVVGDLGESVAATRLQEGWNTMHAEARSMGVETLTLSQFLNQMGYRPQDRSVQLGAQASARDFPAQADDYSRSPGAAQRFRPRTPPRATPAPATTAPVEQ